MTSTGTGRVLTGLMGLTLVGALFLGAAPATATSHENFGTQVKFGDADFIPNVAALATGLIKVSFGSAGDFNDDGFYFDMAGTAVGACAAPTAVATHDIRAKGEVFGKAAGTLVADADSPERGVLAGCWNYGAIAIGALAAGPLVVFGDANSNGRYDLGDPVYLRMSAVAAAGIFAPADPIGPDASGNEVFTLRLTPYQSFLAGSLVRSGDADLTAFGASATVLTGTVGVFGVFNADLSAAPGVFTPGDRLYVTPRPLGVAPAPALAQLYSVRLHGEAGDYGTQVKEGDSDFVPQLDDPAAGAGALPAAGAGSICRVALGVPTDVLDDAYAFDLDQDAVADLHEPLVAAYGGRTPGTLLTSSDTTVVNGPCQSLIAGGANGAAPGGGSAVPNGGFVFADRNNNGRYDLGDTVYYSTSSGPAAGTPRLDAPGATPLGGAAGTGFSLRMTPYSSFAAGTIVRNEDADFIAYAAGVRAMFPGATAGCVAGVVCLKHGVFDANQDGVFSTGDTYYLLTPVFVPGVVANGRLVDLYSVRLAGPGVTFGSVVNFGNADFKPTLSAASVALAWAGIDFGTATQRTDDAYYLDVIAPLGLIQTFDARLVAYAGKAAGTYVLDGDTAERGGGVAIGGPGVLHAGDVNNNGRYDLGDYVWMSSAGCAPGVGGVCGAAFAATAGGVLPTATTLRLTQTNGGAAGTLVFGGSADLTSYGAIGATIQFAAANSWAFFDADLSGGVSSGDSLYIIPVAAGTAAGTTFPLYSIRVAGPLAATTPPPPPPPAGVPPGEPTPPAPPAPAPTAEDPVARQQAEEAQQAAEAAQTAAEGAQMTAEEARDAANEARDAAQAAQEGVTDANTKLDEIAAMLEDGGDETPAPGILMGVLALAAVAGILARRRNE